MSRVGDRNWFVGDILGGILGTEFAEGKEAEVDRGKMQAMYVLNKGPSLSLACLANKSKEDTWFCGNPPWHQCLWLTMARELRS